MPNSDPLANSPSTYLDTALIISPHPVRKVERQTEANLDVSF